MTSSSNSYHKQIFQDGYDVFPDVYQTDEYGLLAIGATLSTDRLIYAYRNGIFPWYSDDEPIKWYAPNERMVLYPKKLIIHKSLKRLIHQHKYTITDNTHFGAVIRSCASIYRPYQDGTWIVNDMINAYIELHKAGWAKSIEVWEEDKLVGGLYGVSVGKVFCGESMFHTKKDTSKLALVHLCSQDYKMIDCQVYTKHLASLGAEIISKKEYMKKLLACREK